MDIERIIFILLVPAAVVAFLLSLLIAESWPVRATLVPVLTFGLIAAGTWIWRLTQR